MTAPKVLFVDDEEELRNAGRQTLELAEIEVETFPSASAVLPAISTHANAILVTDIRMQGTDGVELMKQVHRIDPDLPVILVTGHGDVDLAVESMKIGAYDFLEKPYPPSRLVETIARAQDKRRLTLEIRDLRSESATQDPLDQMVIGRSEGAKSLRWALRAIADTDADVLITGPTGTGKGLAAKAIHAASARRASPFLEINCAALPDTMLESELFGHEAGAFPGALRARFGKFEHARGGTVFLDEIDSLTKPLQAKLLHAIQHRRITRLGSNETFDIDVRFIAATKRDLKKDVETGNFRDDLFYLLNVTSVDVPDLAARKDDIPLLFSHFAADVSRRYDRVPRDIPQHLISDLLRHTWRGGIRELRNAAERFALDLTPFEFETPVPGESAGSLAEQMARHEKSLIASMIAANNGSLKLTYEALGLSRKSLYEKMQKHGLSRQMFLTEDE